MIVMARCLHLGCKAVVEAPGSDTLAALAAVIAARHLGWVLRADRTMCPAHSGTGVEVMS